LQIFYFLLLIAFQLLLLTYVHGSIFLVPLSIILSFIYIFIARSVAGKTVSYASLRRITATHSFFLILIMLDVLIFKILNLDYVSFICSVAVVFSLSLLVIRGGFFRIFYTSFLLLLAYFLIILLPAWRALSSSINLTVIIFWAVVIAVSFRFYRTMSQISKELMGSDVAEAAQAVLDAWMNGYSRDFENILERNSEEISAKTYAFDFYFNDKTKACLVVPPIHPGPFKSTGSSSLPEKIYEAMLKKGYSDCIVLHSLSNHDMNLPSNKQLEIYIKALSGEPDLKLKLTNFKVFKNEGKHFRCVGFDTDQSTLGIVIPKEPMDDFPFGFMTKVFLKSAEVGKELVLVDAHNRLATNFGEVNYEEVFDDCKCDKGSSMQSLYAQFERIDAEIPEIAGAGLHKLTISDLNKTIKLLCADSNNALPEVTDLVEKELGMVLVTSDTHQTSTGMNSKGYWTLGDLTDPNSIIKILQHKVTDQLSEAQVYLNIWNSKIKVMGAEGVKKLRDSMKLVMNKFKIYMIALLVMYIISLVIK